MKKVKINVNGIEEEIDFEDLKDCEGINIVKEIIDKEPVIKKTRIKKKICEITPFVSLIAFLLLGYLKNLWHPGWLVFLAIPLVPLILSLFDHNKKKITAVFTVFVVVVYLSIGLIFHLWHPTWIMFLLIPIVDIIFKNKRF